MNRSMQLHYISAPAFSQTDLFLDLISLEWESHDQSQDTNRLHYGTGPRLPFFHKRTSILKIDQSVKVP